MLGIGLARGRAGLVVAGLLAAAALAVVAVAYASGTTAAKLPGVPKLASLEHTAVALQESRRSQAGPQASAIVGALPSSVSCGQTIKASTTLTADLYCSGKQGLILGASGIVLNLNGHFIYGSYRTEDGTRGVRALSAKDTIVNGYVYGFNEGVVVFGEADAITNVQVTATANAGIFLAGTGDTAISDTAAENGGNGIRVDYGRGDTIQSDHALNNGAYGIALLEGGEKLLNNVVNGNKGAGITTYEDLDTLTGNTANYNDGLGIDVASPQIDGGSNTAHGNTTAEQCRGVVCS